jgi:dTDP-4-amino-4,6-dideoxygalactose transaminase
MSEFKVNFINTGYRRYYAKHRKEILSAIDKCYANGDFVLRDELFKFEKNLAKFVGTKYAVGVNSGTDSLRVAYKTMGLKPGDEVITVSHTFIAPIEEIVHLGGKPIFTDVGQDGLMDVSQIEGLITSKTVGIVPVHLSGKVCDMAKIMKIARKHKLWVVEDACQALGAVYKGKKAGSWGDIGCFSFIAPKTMGVGGDAGALVTNSKKFFERAFLLHNHWNITQGVLHGLNIKQPKIMGWGYNTRLDNIHAAVLNIKLKYYNDLLKNRKRVGEMYNKAFKDLPLTLPTIQEGQIYQEYIVRVDDAYKFKKFMEDRGIEVLVRDVIPNHKLKGLGLEHFNLPVTESMAKSAVRLPSYPELKNEEVREIIRVVKEYYER